jgi:hypothetical protein
MIIKGKMMDGDKLFVGMRNIKYMIKMETSCPNLIIVIVALMHGQFLQLAGDVISHTGSKVPIWINNSRWTCHHNKTVVEDVISIEAVTTYVGSVPHFETHLALWALLATHTSGGRATTAVMEVVGEAAALVARRCIASIPARMTMTVRCVVVSATGLGSTTTPGSYIC